MEFGTKCSQSTGGRSLTLRISPLNPNAVHTFKQLNIVVSRGRIVLSRPINGVFFHSVNTGNYCTGKSKLRYVCAFSDSVGAVCCVNPRATFIAVKVKLDFSVSF